jgi:hypothetical protein
MSYATQHNLPIFSKRQVFPLNGKYFISANLGYETYLGFMNTSPRKDYFAFIDSYNDKSGQFKIGRLDLMDVAKRIKKDDILIEVIPNKYGSIVDSTEFVPRMKSGYLVFTTGEVKMSFFDWVRFMNEKIMY